MGKLAKRGIALVVITEATGHLGNIVARELLARE